MDDLQDLCCNNQYVYCTYKYHCNINLCILPQNSIFILYWIWITKNIKKQILNKI